MLIREVSIRGTGYGISMAMAVMYFITILLIIGILIKIASRWVFYQE
ncbi:MAG: hypothetical protein GX175_05570 [Halanaerobiaceae bacterium]|nr:hypothetical protein [Halanaerobiaceae bacterium]